MNKELENAIILMSKKESALTAIVAWLKGRGLYEEMNSELKLFEATQ